MVILSRFIRWWIGIVAVFVMVVFGAIYLDKLLSTEYVSYVNNDGYFEIMIPKEMRVLAIPNSSSNASAGGEVYFSYEPIDKDRPAGLLVFYESPGIEGKGGACVDNQGNNAYMTEIVAGQTVSVCKEDGFRMEYFRNPNRDVEYWVGTLGEISNTELREFETIVRESLVFY